MSYFADFLGGLASEGFRQRQQFLEEQKQGKLREEERLYVQEQRLLNQADAENERNFRAEQAEAERAAAAGERQLDREFNREEAETERNFRLTELRNSASERRAFRPQFTTVQKSSGEFVQQVTTPWSDGGIDVSEIPIAGTPPQPSPPRASSSLDPATELGNYFKTALERQAELDKLKADGLR